MRRIGYGVSVMKNVITYTYSVEEFDRSKWIRSEGSGGRGAWVTYAEGLATREEAEAFLAQLGRPEARVAEIGRRAEVLA